MKLFYKNKTGFTFVELMVVMAIIAILSTIVIISLSGVREKARDLKRVSDIKTIQSALQMYSTSVGTYPEAITAGNSIVNPNSGIAYLANVPSNPVPRNDGACTNNDYTYIKTSASSYNICFCLASQTGAIKAGINALSSDGKISDCGCKIADREGHEYNTIKIGSQCWMQENLNTGEQINGSIEQGDVANGVKKYCYNNDVNNCNADGALYQWHTAMGLAQSCDAAMSGCTVNPIHNGICPTGWHIPSASDWNTLTEYTGGVDVAGKKLKIILPTWDGSDTYAFSALPSGIKNGADFTSNGAAANFWSTEFNDGEWPISSARVLLSENDTFSNQTFNARNNAYSVRCLKD